MCSKPCDWLSLAGTPFCAAVATEVCPLTFGLVDSPATSDPVPDSEGARNRLFACAVASQCSSAGCDTAVAEACRAVGSAAGCAVSDIAACAADVAVGCVAATVAAGSLDLVGVRLGCVVFGGVPLGSVAAVCVEAAGCTAAACVAAGCVAEAGLFVCVGVPECGVDG